MADVNDFVVIGGGIIGLATARALRFRNPDRSILLLEKESKLGVHQTGHNSGVVHSGVYYRPGSLKARLCVEGRRSMLDFARSAGVRVEECGKLIVATRPSELPRLEELERRARLNDVPQVTRIDAGGISRIEPDARGIAALRIPGTAITDYGAVVAALGRELESAGVEVRTDASVRSASQGDARTTIEAGTMSTAGRFVVNCAGLQADRVAELLGTVPAVRIVPFRGEYHLLSPARARTIRGLIYPVPDPDLPFLGVHLTRRVTGEVEAGPNAVLAFAREGYHRSIVRPAELAETLLYPGFLRMARSHLWTGIYENYRSLDRSALARDLQHLVPSLTADDLVPADSGVRAQAVSREGRPVDDFVIQGTPRALHVLNAPSPGATSSLAIGTYLAEEVDRWYRPSH